VERFEEAVGSFDRVRADLVRRRRGAVAHIMVFLDEPLALNEKTLKTFKQGLELARHELKLEESA